MLYQADNIIDLAIEQDGNLAGQQQAGFVFAKATYSMCSTIAVTDPNDSDDPQYIGRLVKKVVTVGVETMRVVNTL